MKKKMRLISLLCILLDQFSKLLIQQFLELNQSIYVTSFFQITYVKNEGAAWSLFSGQQLFLIFISIGALYFLYHYFIKGKKLSLLEEISYGLLLGGIIGNLFDRFFRGYVIDYFAVIIFRYHFPVFNIADICIVIAIILMILLIWKEEKIYGDDHCQSK